jgi:hypothetical protein
MAAPIPEVSVAICVPSGDTWKAETAAAIQAISLHTIMQGGVPVYLFNRRAAMIAVSRNELVRSVLQYEGITHIMWYDSDMAAPPNALLRLLAHDKSVTGAFYNRRKHPFEPLGSFWGEPSLADLRAGGLRRAIDMPGGFTLVKTSVYRDLPYPWYFDVIKWPSTNPVEAFLAKFQDEASMPCGERQLAALRTALNSPDLAKWLEVEHKTASELLSEDYAFSRKARRAGYGVWCDLDLSYEIAHIAEVPVIRQRPEEEAVSRPQDS